MDNTGSFGAAISPDAGAAIKAAMSTRGMDSSVLNQNTQDPNAVMPGQPPTGQGGMPPPVSGQVPTQPPPPLPPTAENVGASPAMGNPEKQIILKAMDQALKSITKIEEVNAGIV